MKWSFYDPASGLFHASGFKYFGPDDGLESNTPPGYVAIAGDFDASSKRLNVATGEVEDYTPPPPTPEQAAAAVRSDALSRIQSLEAGQHRAIREAVLTGDQSRLKAIDEQIAALRAALK